MEQPRIDVANYVAPQSPAPPAAAYPGLPPDLVVVVAALIVFQALEWVHRRHVGPRFASYKRLPFRDRFDWDKRFFNLTFQGAQFFSNAYLLTLDRAATADCLYGYSRVAHASFLVIIAFYVYDTAGIVMHPSPPSSSAGWIFHHLVATGLLLYDVSYKRSSAFPAAALLISAVGHVPNELRWFCAATQVSSQAVLNLTLVLCAAVAVVALGIPPPYLLLRAARQLRLSVWELVTTRMRSYCVFFFLLIYAPHVMLVFTQLHRLVKYWGKPVEPFRTRKVD